ncbi:hypothetical protein CH333_03320 [candidate division WOR-3 bacterium JGI_Cruoil_03_44_89]|uniref:Methyltransferase domain-containing protein n=2 Tax=candidate division WOR-3 bacterium JGI_Cruoil_03_44_89 TaxID=1973748 RepID=A0A235BXF0_UNCW3|nr:MAG: hypothetical protein CH333_03320 [candidate division WOR-3 bacterium JGI_Cruoil_03_44_89]
MEWWKSFFDEPYGEAILESFEERASGEVDFIEDVLSLPKNAKILDLCCGLGRHSIELAKRGYEVTGVDVTSQYLETARTKAKEKGVEIDFIESDMRNISFYEEFDAVINMFTSFGFFEEENYNLKVLQNVSNALKPKGKFLIDVINRDWIIKNYKERDWRESGEGLVLEVRKFDLARSINYGKQIIIRGEERIEKNVSLRMYSFHELKAMLESVGFEVIAFYGSFEKGELTFDSMRMKIVSRKIKQ